MEPIDTRPLELLRRDSNRLQDARQLIGEQADDDGLWFRAATAPEAMLQNALRRLHEAIEGKTSEECAMEALNNLQAPVPLKDAGEPQSAGRAGIIPALVEKADKHDAHQGEVCAGVLKDLIAAAFLQTTGDAAFSVCVSSRLDKALAPALRDIFAHYRVQTARAAYEDAAKRTCRLCDEGLPLETRPDHYPKHRAGEILISCDAEEINYALADHDKAQKQAGGGE